MMFILILASVPGAYLNAVLMCYLVNVVEQHGLVFNLLKAMKLMWPAFKAMLWGIVPAILLTTVIQEAIPSLTHVPLLMVPLGALASAVLLHRVLLTEVTKKGNWNISITILVLIQVGLGGMVLLQFGDSL